MMNLILVRHARSSANSTGVLAGRMRGVHLDEIGKKQGRALGEILRPLKITALYSSPLERCLETSRLINIGKSPAQLVKTSELIEADYGDWSGKKLSTLSRKPLWKLIQRTPSQVRFPSGESFLEMNSRAIEVVERIIASHAGRATPQNVVIVSHGDVIKVILAHFLGMHLDTFQRLVVDPCSASVVRVEGGSRFLVGQNLGARGLAGCLRLRSSVATVGGGDGA